MNLKPLSTAFSRAQTDDPVNRETHDFYPTHPGATRALLSVESFDGPVWEPACGDGAMSRVLEAAGLEVTSTDLIDRGYGEGGRDFLMEWAPRAPHIVTNPPFRLAEQFIARALETSRIGVAMIVRAAFLEGVGRHERLYSVTPPSDVLQFSERVVMHKGRLAPEGSTATAYAWLVWIKGCEDATRLRWIAPCRKRLECAGDYDVPECAA